MLVTRRPWKHPSSALVLTLLLLGAAIGAASAGAEPPPRSGDGPPTRAVELELKERSATASVATLRATVGSAIGDPGQLALETAAGVFYKLRLRRDHRGVLYLDLERSQRGPAGSLKLQTAAQLDARGKPSLLARLSRPDGSGLEVTAALR